MKKGETALVPSAEGQTYQFSFEMEKTIPENSVIYILFPTQFDIDKKLKDSYKIRLEPDPGGEKTKGLPSDKVECASKDKDYMFSDPNIARVAYKILKPWESSPASNAPNKRVITVEGLTNPKSTDQTNDFWILITDEKGPCIAVSKVIGIKMGDPLVA